MVCPEVNWTQMKGEKENFHPKLKIISIQSEYRWVLSPIVQKKEDSVAERSGAIFMMKF